MFNRVVRKGISDNYVSRDLKQVRKLFHGEEHFRQGSSMC